MCLYVLFPSSTSSTYIALQHLGIFDIFDINSITFKENENDISDIFDISHTLYSVRITMLIVIQSILIRTNFELKPCNSSD